MSDRDKQKKYDEASNISSSFYSRVNAGQHANNKFDSPQLIHQGGSMQNDDEKNEKHVKQSSLLYMIVYYAFGLLSSFVIGFAILQMFRDYFYGSGMYAIFPSFLLLVVSLVAGFILSKLVIKKAFPKLRK